MATVAPPLYQATLPPTLPRPSITSWGAILAGAAAAAALSLILLALGSGLGLSSVSPWSYEGASASTLGVAAIVWLIAMSGAASALGGYIAGRMRDAWPDADSNERYFRDTVHGLIAWSVATLLSAALLASAATTMAGGALKTSATVAGAAAGSGAVAAGGLSAGGSVLGASQEYFVDMMFRGTQAGDDVDREARRREVGGVMAQAMTSELSPGDRAYLGRLVAAQTGLSPAEAEQRVSQTVSAAMLAAEAAESKAKAAADTARAATATLALWVFVSLLFGAFCAALAATFGGRARDV